jgi:hypothetical protein
MTSQNSLQPLLPTGDGNVKVKVPSYRKTPVPQDDVTALPKRETFSFPTGGALRVLLFPMLLTLAVSGCSDDGGASAVVSLSWASAGNPAGTRTISGTLNLPSTSPSGDIVQLYVENVEDASHAAGGTNYTLAANVTAIGGQQQMTYQVTNLPAGSYWVCATLTTPNSPTPDLAGCYNGTTGVPVQKVTLGTAISVTDASASSINFGIALGQLGLARAGRYPSHVAASVAR